MYSKKDIVVINFPYSDLINSKRRPVLIIAEKGEDFITCAITSNPAVKGVRLSFSQGDLPLKSVVKHWQIQPILKSRAEKKLARKTNKCNEEIIQSINK